MRESQFYDGVEEITELFNERKKKKKKFMCPYFMSLACTSLIL